MIEVENFANDWLVSNVVLRESRHTPYRYVLKQRKFKEQSIENTKNLNQKSNNYLIDLISSGKINLKNLFN